MRITRVCAQRKIKQALAAERVTVRDMTLNFVAGARLSELIWVARAVSTNPKARGILVCGSGVGVSPPPPRKSERELDAHSLDEVKWHRELSNDANIIALSGWKMKIQRR